MNAADTPGGKDLNASPRCDGCRRSDRGCTVTALRNDDGQIPAAHFAYAFLGCQVFQFSIGQTNPQLPVEHGNGGRSGSVLADDGFHLPCSLQVGGVGQSVRNDGRL
jgi:hypothetical protein